MTFRYDSRGNKTNVVHRLSAIVDDYTYNSSGQMTTHVWPDNGSNHRRTDLMTYYSSGPQKGYLQQSVVNSGGFNLTTSYAYDLAGNVTNAIDARGSNTIYSVNSLNQVVRTFSPAVSTTNGLVRYQTSTYYDANNDVIRTDVQNVDDGGNLVASLPNLTTTNVFDILNALLATVRQVATNHYVTTACQYDANGNPTLTRSAVATSGLQSNNVESFVFDELDLVYQEILAPNDPNHSTTQLDYDGNHNLVRRSQGTESTPRITTYAYDGYDRQTISTDAMGNVTTLNYDPNGNAISNRVNGELMDVPGSAGNVRLSATAYAYDNEDRPTTTDASFFDTATQAAIGTGHAITTIGYSANSQVLTNIDANTNVTVTLYDTADRVSVVTDPKSNTVTYSYDANHNVIKTAEVDLSDLGSPAQTIQTTNIYDSLNRLVQTVDQLGITNRYAYDSRNNRVQTIDGRGSVIRYTYDGLSRTTATTRFLSTGGQAITSQSLDDNSRLTSQTDDNTNTTTYVYDALNRQVRTVFADGTTNGVSYDVHGNALVASDANLNVVNTTYDLGNRPIAKAITRGSGISGTTSETNQFDGLSRIVLAGNNDSLVVRSYSSLSRILRETQQVVSSGAPAQTLAFTYDSAGNCLASTYPGGRTVNYTYDRLNRRQMVTNAAGLIAAYSYIGPGRVERRDYGNGTRMLIDYDAIRRLTNHSHLVISSGTNFESRGYAWDAAHNQTAMTDRLAPALDARTFSYNSLNQLTQSVTAVVGPTIIYNLDHVGNRLSVASGTNVGTYFMNSAAPPADFQMNQYSTTPFDGRTNDANGNLIVTDGPATGLHRFSYDYRDRLVTFTNSVPGPINKYDCFNRRIEKAVNGTTTRYYYDGWQEIEEQNGTNATVATYVYGNGIDELLTMDRGGQRRFFHEDSLGSIRKVTDNTGGIVEQYRYDDYGQPTFLNGAGTVIPATQITNATLFTGRRYDAETGNYYYRTRYLDPRAGRFTTRDTIGIWGDAGNLGNGYSYNGNEPISRTDPFGLVQDCGAGANEGDCCYNNQGTCRLHTHDDGSTSLDCVHDALQVDPRGPEQTSAKLTMKAINLHPSGTGPTNPGNPFPLQGSFGMLVAPRENLGSTGSSPGPAQLNPTAIMFTNGGATHGSTRRTERAYGFLWDCTQNPGTSGHNASDWSCSFSGDNWRF
jgi:RHS repeat-associated protein